MALRMRLSRSNFVCNGIYQLGRVCLVERSGHRAPLKFKNNRNRRKLHRARLETIIISANNCTGPSRGLGVVDYRYRGNRAIYLTGWSDNKMPRKHVRGSIWAVVEKPNNYKSLTLLQGTVPLAESAFAVRSSLWETYSLDNAKTTYQRGCLQA